MQYKRRKSFTGSAGGFEFTKINGQLGPRQRSLRTEPKEFEDDQKKKKEDEKSQVGALAMERYQAENQKQGMNDRQAEEVSLALLAKIKTNIREEKMHNQNLLNNTSSCSPNGICLP